MSDRTTEPEEPEGWEALGASFRAATTPEATSFDDVDPAAVRARAEDFARKIRHRNVREIVSAGVVALAGARIAYRASSPFMVIGGASLALAALFVTTIVVLRAKNVAPPPTDAATRVVVAFERSELERQAHLLETVWLWYLVPFVPSVVAIYASVLAASLEHGATRGACLSVLLFAATLGVFVGIGRFNARAARELRAKMAVLPADQE